MGSYPPIPMHTFRANYVGLLEGSLCPTNRKALETAPSSQTVRSLPERNEVKSKLGNLCPFAMFHTNMFVLGRILFGGLFFLL